jgi:hypothetical protein
MRTRSLAIAALLLGVLSAPVRADWGPYGLVGNDTGGIIPWSPETEFYRLAITADFCARWGKVAKISSVHRVYGDYIGFHCLFPPSYTYTLRSTHRRQVVLYRKY